MPLTGPSGWPLQTCFYQVPLSKDTFSEFLLIFQWYWCVSSFSNVLITLIRALGITLGSSAIAIFHSNDSKIFRHGGAPPS